MTRDEINRMAQEADLTLIHGRFLTEQQEKFARLVAAAEREACAVMYEELSENARMALYLRLDQIAEAIRARGRS